VLENQLMSEPGNTAIPEPSQKNGFGTFAGVFTPTLLTILGVIMYLRLGWVVGNAGLLGGWLVIMVAVVITLSTGLSLSSIATNTRLGAGGPYAIISKSLGQEIGGSVGVPLFLSQALAVSMYVFGFREGWLWIFPGHNALLIDLAAFVAMLCIAYISADLAFKVQYVIMAVIGLSLVSIFAAPDVWTSENPITWWGNYAGSPTGRPSSLTFWAVFAVFFPASTGIMAGANMSGELKNPRVSIPKGTLSAIGLSTVVYFALAAWVAKAGTTEELLGNYTIMIDKALWGPIVVAGLLGATFSSGLTSLVGAPRILTALGNHGIVPGGHWVSRMAGNGEPRRALLVTSVLVLGGLAMRDLNVIAPLITMFFLITYAVINCVMLIESRLGLVSFRPTLRLPIVVPLVGAVGCVFAMFIVAPSFSLISVGMVITIYFGIMQRARDSNNSEDVRSGIFVAFAEWAAAKVIEYDIVANARAWKPNLLVPVEDPAELRGEFRLLVDMCRPEGSVKLLGLATTETVSDLTPRVRSLGKAFQKHKVFSTGSVIDSADYQTGILAGLQALGSAFFKPNVLFLTLPSDDERQVRFHSLLRESKRLKIGVALLAMHPKAGLGREKVIHLWVAPRAADHPLPSLAILMSYRLMKTWEAELSILTVVPEESELAAGEQYLEEVCDLCRMPEQVARLVLVGSFNECLAKAPQSDLDIMGMLPEGEASLLWERVHLTRSSCLYTVDSGSENALA
jgi:solute carrier family 12 (sodium/potassium/chloride transporter), member 2